METVWNLRDLAQEGPLHRKLWNFVLNLKSADLPLADFHWIEFSMNWKFLVIGDYTFYIELDELGIEH